MLCKKERIVSSNCELNEYIVSDVALCIFRVHLARELPRCRHLNVFFMRGN